MDWGQNLFSFGANTAMGFLNDFLARRREKEARKENFTYNEQAADNAQTRQWETINQFYTPQAQIQQLKEAGLSPSLMYGQGGTTGQSVAPQGAGTAGIAPNYQSLLGIAQIHALEAQANLQNAQARTEEGENATGAAKIAEMLANAGAQKANQEWTETQTAFQKLQNYFTSTTMPYKIEEAKAMSETAQHHAVKALLEAQEAGFKLEITENTKDALIQMAWNDLEKSLQDIALKETEITLNQEKAKQVIAEISQKWRELGIYEKSVDNQKEFWDNEIQKRGEEIAAVQGNVDKQVAATKRGQVLNIVSTISGAAIAAVALYFTKSPKASIAAGTGAAAAIQGLGLWLPSSTSAGGATYTPHKMF